MAAQQFSQAFVTQKMEESQGCQIPHNELTRSTAGAWTDKELAALSNVFEDEKRFYTQVMNCSESIIDDFPEGGCRVSMIVPKVYLDIWDADNADEQSIWMRVPPKKKTRTFREKENESHSS
jgi:hypothetical protein